MVFLFQDSASRFCCKQASKRSTMCIGRSRAKLEITLGDVAVLVLCLGCAFDVLFVDQGLDALLDQAD